MSQTNKMIVQVPQDIVRNTCFTLSPYEFLLYARLQFLYFRGFKQSEEITFDHHKLRLNIGITDTRTLKKYFQKLHHVGLLKTEVTKIPKAKEMAVILNSKPQNIRLTPFTQLPATIFNWVNKLDEHFAHAIRLLFYYKSYIDKEKKFAHMGFRRIMSELKISSNKIDECNDLLVKNKLLKIERFQLEPTYEYGEHDEMIFDKFTNHYTIREENI